jgi:hypothetical protein
VAPNGHKKARKRCLRDAGVKYILYTCCSLFNGLFQGTTGRPPFTPTYERRSPNPYYLRI